ncbi:MAG TPA: superinfection immunity protein [Candidatus Binatia bacterium]|jgi:hypothetical protein
MGTGLGMLGGLLLLSLILAFYFLPVIIAAKLETKHEGMIFLINIVFGWTVLGWIAALIWAIVETPEEPNRATAAAARVAPYPK